MIVLFLFLQAVPLAAQLPYAWVQKSSLPAPARHRASGCAVGGRGYLGLGHVNSTGQIIYQDWWEFDPGTNTWTQKADYAGGARFGAVAFAIGNYAYVGTGDDYYDQGLRNDFFKYDPLTNQWTGIAAFPGPPTATASCAMANGKGYMGLANATTGWWAYDPASDSWQSRTAFPGPQRNYTATFELGGKIYTGTGITYNYTTMYADFWCYDPATDSWTQKTAFPAGLRYCSSGFSYQGKGYIGLGYSTATTNNYDDFWAYDPVSNSWSPAPQFAGSARRLCANFTIGNRVYLGTGTNGTNFNDLWEYGTLSAASEINGAPAFSFFPNPAKDELTLTFSCFTNGHIRIYTADGRLLIDEQVHGLTARVHCGQLQPGTYYMTISSGDENRHLACFVVTGN